MPFGGLFKALTGQTDARAQAAQMNTKAGSAAIGNQMRRAQQGAVAQQYSLAASARGGSTPLALREAQRRGQMASQDIAGQGGILQKQLEQAAAQQNAMNQQQANNMNTNIQMQNDQAFGKFVQGAVQAGAGAMMLSDARAKHAAFVAGQESATPYRYSTGGMDAGGDFGDATLNAEALRAGTSPHSVAAATSGGPIGSGMSFEERQGVADYLRKRDEQATMARHAAEVGAPAPGMPAPAAAPVQQPSAGQSLLMGGLQQISDARAKQAEEENGVLRSVLARLAPPPPPMQRAAPAVASAAAEPRSEADALRMGAEWTRRNNAAVLQDMTGQPMTVDPARAKAQAELDAANRGRAQFMAQTQQVSDERAKMYSDKELKFPDGVKPAEFSYRPGIEGMPGAPPGEHVGVLAQDLEKSPEGATVVEEDPETGMKMVDTQQLTMLLTAKLAEMDAKLDKLAGKKKKAKSDG